MPPKTQEIALGSLHTQKRNADEYRIMHGVGAAAVYCGHITYTAQYGWDAYSLLDHRYLPNGPYGHGDEGLAKATNALKKELVRRGSLQDGWDT